MKEKTFFQRVKEGSILLGAVIAFLTICGIILSWIIGYYSAQASQETETAKNASAIIVVSNNLASYENTTNDALSGIQSQLTDLNKNVEQSNLNSASGLGAMTALERAYGIIKQ